MKLLSAGCPLVPVLAAGWVLWGAAAGSPAGAAGQAVPVAAGKGSYASFPPPEAGDAVGKMAATPPAFLLDPGNRPIPTNKWWTDMLVHPFGGQLWAFPLMVKADARGADVFFPIKWNDAGTDPVSDSPLSVHGTDFHPAGARVTRWGDWTVTYRQAERPDRFWDVTLGRGLPYVWFECHGVAPQIAAGADVTFFDEAGRPVALPVSASHIGLTSGGRSYGLFAPAGARFTTSGGQGLSCEFAGAARFLVVCPLPHPSDLAYFARFAGAIPRDSRMTWSYDPDAAQVTTRWHLTTEALQGTERRLIQGWLPHHYRGTVSTLALTGPSFLTPRGTLKCAAGTDFQIIYPFHGFLPVLPPPHAAGLPHDFDAGRMRDFLARYAARTGYGEDTYWGGKDLLQLAQYMAIAHEMGDPSFARLRDTLRTALADWFTYTPGEKAHFFARYPAWHALIGIKPSYGSEQFNDNHFHYGYFTTAAALLGLYDPQFLRDYGEMARLVARQYADWDRDDPAFPFLRTLDIWEGHSWASGLSSPTGPNQESSSEAVQSWGGLFLLGTALGDKAMTAAGAMGYAMETQAVQEYWFNIHGDNFSPNYAHPITGMVWGGGNLYGTYFSGDPAWIFGIQWLPMSPMLSYLVRDPEFARRSFRTMLAEREKKNGTAAIAGLGTALGNVVLGEAGQVNPDWTAEQLDALWAANDPIAHDNDTPGLTYYMTHAVRHLGARQWDWHMSLPTSSVFLDARTHVSHFVVYNPLPTPQRVLVYHQGLKAGFLLAPPHTLVSQTSLSAASPKAP